LDKRKLELGIGSAAQNADFNALLFKEGSIEKEKEKFSKVLSKMMVP
jgi:hypothetical protein